MAETCLSAWLRAIALTMVIVLLSACTTGAMASAKRGVGIRADQANAGAIVRQLGVDWYYTWSVRPLAEVDEVRFIPLIWGPRSADQLPVVCPRRCESLFAMNEPDRADQSNLSVEEAVETANEIRPFTGSLIGINASRALGPWARSFYAVSDGTTARMDAIAIHWYGHGDAEDFLAYVRSAHAYYRRPIWVTEFAVYDPPDGDTRLVERFMREAVAGLEQMDFVAGYAWFGTPRPNNSDLQDAALFTIEGELTALGQLYATLN